MYIILCRMSRFLQFGQRRKALDVLAAVLGGGWLASEWVREYSQKIADDAQRAIIELHQKIAESAERAMADFGGRRSAPDASPEEAPSPDEGTPSPENREDQET